jgi:cytochrome c peroxidase
VARALAAFVRTLLAGTSPFDRFEHGDDTALSEQARQGLDLFRGRANCIACHVGATFTDEQFHNTGVAWRNGRFVDDGRFVVTRRPEDRGAFKTPSLREVARTAPYMHDGSLATLEEIVDFYDGGGNHNPYLDPELRPLGLRMEEKQALLGFLRSLTGDIHEGLDPVSSPHDAR